MATRITVNQQAHDVDAAPDTPLLYVLMNDLALQGPRFGCGLAQRGSCSVLVDGVEMRSCVTPLRSVVGGSVTTLEGLATFDAQQRKLATVQTLHPIQQVIIDEQALQCGYCYNGMIVKAAELPSKNPQPSDDQIRSAMNGHLCRCSTYPRMMNAIHRAAQTMAGGGR